MTPKRAQSAGIATARNDDRVSVVTSTEEFAAFLKWRQDQADKTRDRKRKRDDKEELEEEEESEEPTRIKKIIRRNPKKAKLHTLMDHFVTYFGPHCYSKGTEENEYNYVNARYVTNALSNISPNWRKKFTTTVLPSLFVLVDSLPALREFHIAAFTQASNIRGRICFHEANWAATSPGSNWKRDVHSIMDLIGQDFGFKSKKKFIDHLKARDTMRHYEATADKTEVWEVEPTEEMEDDKKLLRHKDGWSIVVSCDRMLYEKEMQVLKVWGDIGKLGRLWEHFTHEKEERDGEGEE